MERNDVKIWEQIQVCGDVPYEIIAFLQKCFMICEIRAKVHRENGIEFCVRTREKNHALPHVHASYGDYTVSIAIGTGEILGGNLPKKQQRYATEWVLGHKHYLASEWSRITINALSSCTQSMLDSKHE